MRHGTRPARRAGFTLIELLVVISILALLAALTAAGINQVRVAQINKATGQTLTKLQKALDQQVGVTIQDAVKESNPNYPAALAFCDGDKDRAKSLLSFVDVKWEFPVTFDEARSGVVIVWTGLPIVRQPRKTFATLPTSAASGLSPADQSAALLYLILTEKNSRGAGVAIDELTNSAQTTVGSFKAFKDANGIPIAYQRWFSNDPDLNQAPYVNPKDGVPPPNGFGSVDPFDKLGRLVNWTTGGAPVNKPIAQTALNLPLGSPPVAFDGKNKVITVVAAGEDKALGSVDDKFGYMLARFGNQGN